MGSFLSRCVGCPPKPLVDSKAGPENEGVELTEYRHRSANVIVYLRHLETQITDNPFEAQALNLGTVRDKNSEEGYMSSNDGSFSEPATASVARNGIHQLEGRLRRLIHGSSIDPEMPVRDHEMLWEILRARPGWEREVHKGARGITKGFVQYQIKPSQTKKRLQFPSACPLPCRLPWPELYEASTDMLSSFVEMVNMCRGSRILELRIANDLKTNTLRSRPLVNTMPSSRPKNGTNGSQADNLSRAAMEGDRRTTISTPMFSNSSQAAQDVDLDSAERIPTSDHTIRIGVSVQAVLRASQDCIQKRGPIETATGEQPAVRNSENPGLSKASEQTLAARPNLFANIPRPDGRAPPVFFRDRPAILQSSSDEAAYGESKLFTPAAPTKLVRNSEDLQRGEVSKQTSGVPPSGLFANVPKPDGRPPPVSSKQSFRPPSAKRIRTGAGPEVKLLTTDALQKISNDFDSCSTRPPRRKELVTFADPYQTPYRGTTSSYVRNEYPNLRKQPLLKDFLAPVMGSGSRLTL